MPYLFIDGNAGILTTNLIFYLKVSSPLSVPKCQHHQKAEIAKASETSGSLLGMHSGVCNFDAALTRLCANLVSKAKHQLQV